MADTSIEVARRRSRVAVVGYFLLILAATLPATRMLEEAWNREQLVYQLTWALVDATGTHIDFVVLVPAGFVLGLLFVFCLDGFKRVQATLLVATVPFFALSLLYLGLWTSRIQWGAHWWALPAGIGLGLLVGAIDGIRTPSGLRRRFPAVSGLLSTIVATSLLVGFLERHVVYPSPLLVRGEPATGVAVVFDRWLLVYLPITVALLAVVRRFFTYSDRSDVAILSPDEREAVALLSGLFEASDAAYDDVRRTVGESLLIDAAVADDPREVRDASEVNASVGFQYVPNRAFAKLRDVSSARYGAPSNRELDELRRRAAADGNVRAAARTLARTIVPDRIRRPFRTRSHRRIERIDGAESIVLVVPLSDFVRSDLDPANVNDYEEILTSRRPSYLDTFAELMELYADDPRRGVYLVPTESHLAVDAYRARYGNSPPGRYEGEQLSMFLVRSILDIEDPTGWQIVPVTHDDSDGSPAGFTSLLSKL